jgi:hypothetical protein
VLVLGGQRPGIRLNHLAAGLAAKTYETAPVPDPAVGIFTVARAGIVQGEPRVDGTGFLRRDGSGIGHDSPIETERRHQDDLRGARHERHPPEPETTARVADRRQGAVDNRSREVPPGRDAFETQLVAFPGMQDLRVIEPERVGVKPAGKPTRAGLVWDCCTDR